MKISTKGQYALRMMLDLAINNTGEYITIKSIAARQSLPEKYMEQIMTSLSKAGYVKSIRGSKGGYQLADKLENYTVGMILRTIEGSLSPVSLLDDIPNSSLQSQNCVTFDVWKELNDAINNVVDNITLEELVQRQLAKAGNDYMI
ncbi:RrF2 family transcriptional regulator [[Clostridium] fimetarium]|uniref:Rrf2 family protein n=1 Tax=[Clostridium] fimetarium TaxID=99656 RepID=A0A1I0PPM8_9FIRM|nr:Rrf2 family transcriptional regulator [[Clostridium] fimetarium]SEW16201.1 Rrf2 family protein [[Clostridium] fimetarium]